MNHRIAAGSHLHLPEEQKGGRAVGVCNRGWAGAIKALALGVLAAHSPNTHRPEQNSVKTGQTSIEYGQIIFAKVGGKQHIPSQ